MKTRDIKRDNRPYFFQFRIFLLKFENFLFLFQRLILKLENLVLKLENLRLKFCNFLLKKYYRIYFVWRAFWCFVIHGILLDDKLDFLYDDTQQ